MFTVFAAKPHSLKEWDTPQKTLPHGRRVSLTLFRFQCITQSCGITIQTRNPANCQGNSTLTWSERLPTSSSFSPFFGQKPEFHHNEKSGFAVHGKKRKGKQPLEQKYF
jgi:hypothetical protein